MAKKKIDLHDIRFIAENGKRLFSGPMMGGLWFGRCLDAGVISKYKGDNAAYEFLIKFGDRYVLSLDADQKRQWQEIKNHV